MYKQVLVYRPCVFSIIILQSALGSINGKTNNLAEIYFLRSASGW